MTKNEIQGFKLVKRLSIYSTNSQIMDTKMDPLLGKFNPENISDSQGQNSISEEIMYSSRFTTMTYLTPSNYRLTAFSFYI